MENCYWEKIQSIPTLPCLSSGLLPIEAILTKPECNNTMSSISQGKILHRQSSHAVDAAFNSCDCPKRCNATEYQVSSTPSAQCLWESGLCSEPGHTCLLLRFPSTRVRSSSVLFIDTLLPSRSKEENIPLNLLIVLQVSYILEKEKMNLLDLLSNIGGIVGLCLGVSLISVFDLVEFIYFIVRDRLKKRRNAINLDGKN